MVAEGRADHHIGGVGLHGHELEDVAGDGADGGAVHAVVKAHGQHRDDGLPHPERHIEIQVDVLVPDAEIDLHAAVGGLQLFQQGAAHGRGVVHGLGQLFLVQLAHIAKAAQPGLHLLVGQGMALGHLGLAAGKGGLHHIHQHGLVFVVVGLLAAEEVFQPHQHAVGVLLGGQLADG